MINYLYKSFDILGYVIFIDYGQTYHILCNEHYESEIKDIANSENITQEVPIFVDTADSEQNICETCHTLIILRND